MNRRPPRESGRTPHQVGALTVFLLLLPVASAASAQSSPGEWIAPRACGDRSALDQRIRELAPELALEELRVDALVDRTPDGAYRIAFELDCGDRAQRTITSASCDALLSTVALVVATACSAPELDSEARPAEADAVAVPRHMPETPPVRAPEPPEAVPVVDGYPLVGAATVVEHGWLPEAEPSLSVWLGASIHGVELDAWIRGTLAEQRGVLSNGDDAGMRRFAFRLRLGYSVPVGRFTIGAFFVQDVGEYRLVSRSPTQGAARGISYGVGAGVTGRWWIVPNFGIDVTVDVVGVALADPLVIDAGRYLPGPVAVLTAVGCVGRIP